MSAAGSTSLRWCGECCPCPCREELKALRKQMAEIEKSMTEQLFTNQQRAQEAYVRVLRPTGEGSYVVTVAVLVCAESVEAP